MSDDLSVFREPHAKEAVQDLRELLSQTRVAFMLGAGCSFDAGLPLMQELTTEVMDHGGLRDATKHILVSLEDLYSGATRPTIEDYMSDLVDYSSVADRRSDRGAQGTSVEIGARDLSPTDLSTALAEIKLAVSKVIDGRDLSLSNHQKFVRSVHLSLEAGKTTRTVDYFVLNYDTLLEDALGIEKIPYTDGFAGTVTGWWQPSTFEDSGISARVLKIHGSIDWCLLKGDSLPRRIRKGLKIDSEQTAVLIYPASPKFQEVQKDPFAQLLANMRRSLRPTEREQAVLCICGYSFQDSHINLEIENALYESDGRLTVLAFIDDDELTGALGGWADDAVLSSQIRIYTSERLVLQGATSKFETSLPWWKFEVLARLLGGER